MGRRPNLRELAAKAKARDTGKTPREIAAEITAGSRPVLDYREASLRIHGLICAKCGREFEESNRHLLTVHHKDSNRWNNPPDGSNWENLCVWCHDDEHNRGNLGEYLSGGGKK